MAQSIARLNSADRDFIARRVGRLHVSTSNAKVVRYFAGGISRTWRKRVAKCTRATRKRVYRAAIKAHARNRALYSRVVSGRI